MKRCILFLLFNISWISLHSQEFAEKDTEYVYNYSSPFSAGINLIKYSRDTIIDGRRCRVLSKTLCRYDYSTLDSACFERSPFFIYSQNGLIEFSYDGDKFDTLYHYSGAIGDSWSVITKDQRDEIIYSIIDTFRTTINEYKIFTQEIGWSLPSDPENIRFIDTVYEYIGSKWDYMDPTDWDAREVDSGEGGVLRCFKNDLLGTVDMMSPFRPQYYNYDCGDEITALNDPNLKNIEILVYPNPTSDMLTIDWEGNDGIPIKIINTQGKICLNTNLKFGKNTLDLSRQSPGVYFVVSQGKLLSKLVVSR